MFSDLVHIELIRLTKSRVFLVGLFITLATIAFIALTMPSFLVNSSYNERIAVDVSAGDDYNKFSTQMVTLSMFTWALTMFGCVNVVFATCDYYKFREFVNIRGSIRSRIKLSISEIVGILIQSVVLAAVPIATLPFMQHYDESSLLSVYPLAVVMLFFAYAWSILNNSLLHYAISKLVRVKAVSLAVIPVMVFFQMMFYGAMTGVITAKFGELGSEIATALSNPTMSMVDVMLSEGWLISVFIPIGFAFCQTLIYCVLGVLFSLRSEKI